ncbi:myelin-oligodendrocyte glycoprotein-like [Tachysurus vachellii]|uniref:myelin-oligodendrocyte glycoprotein-like n=1 Tax=Tachysurus vachellii TaxID=175792 RepID=UPI00296B3B2F|nr:myelin-oligodendrocyte glycoprotein-like [Tachysurus vachellii]
MPNRNLGSTSKRCLLFFMVYLLIYNVLVQNIEIHEAFVGDTVILPCSIDRTVVSEDVFWRDDDGAVVVDIIKNKEDFYEQSPEYRDRVQTFPNEIENGNFSIKLSNVTLSDSRTYTCKASGSVQSVKLSVKQAEKIIVPRNSDVTIRTSSLFLLGFSLLYSLDF